jgi:hypothetical protein
MVVSGEGGEEGKRRREKRREGEASFMGVVAPMRRAA